MAIKAKCDMAEALAECEEYFEQRADAEYFTESAYPVGNEEMHMFVLVKKALGKL